MNSHQFYEDMYLYIHTHYHHLQNRSECCFTLFPDYINYQILFLDNRMLRKDINNPKQFNFNSPTSIYIAN